MNGEGKIIISEDGRLVLKALPSQARHSPSAGLRRRKQKSAALDTTTAGSSVEGDRPANIEQAISTPEDNMSAAPSQATNQLEIDQHGEMDVEISDADNDMANDHLMRDFDYEASHSPSKSVSKVSRKDLSAASAALKSLAARNSNFSRAFWEKRVKYPTKGAFSIGSVIEHLGLKRHQTGTNFSFKDKTVNKLAQALRVVTHKISDGDDARVVDAHVVDVAVDPAALVAEVDELMEKFGEKIWGAEGEKEWLETLGEYGEYTHELHYHDEEENKLIREYLRLWIVLKAVNTRIYVKYRKVAVKAEVEEEESMDESEADDELDRELDAYDSDSPAIGKEARHTKTRHEEYVSAIKTAENKFARLRAARDALELEETTNGLDVAPGLKNLLFPTAQKTEEDPDEFVSTVAQRLVDGRRTRRKTPVYNEKVLAGIKKRGLRKDKGIPHKPVSDAPVDSAAINKAHADASVPPSGDQNGVMQLQLSVQLNHVHRHTNFTIRKKRALSPSSHSRPMQQPQKKKKKPIAHENPRKKGKKPAAPIAPYTEDPDPIRRRMLHSRPLTTAFLRYLDPHVRSKYSSKSLLANIELGSTHLMLAVVPIALPTILTAWLTYQRTVASVKKRTPAALDSELSKVDSVVTRSRLRTELRMARDAFVASHENAQAVLRRAMENMLGGDERAEYVGDGMKQLDEELEALGKSLGGGK
ncbi:hypothetical protein SNOG_08173 [Parastagonospora nodorum SN15]|uniref:Uncharacterized protein n=1 Tax=Phaeosphaeria nodorum (strain SN15 / ATCC MYA-4574 / FGSC 10173) TaxID=321614 RepID=Q0UJ91_PHANO|nr:hypothetical protein SNOG_08173 [Parastagonospora nodorum SN15]EAT84449.2 hypothetical protein SNOG_08173 [Parastagonospora nodorum SN15]